MLTRNMRKDDTVIEVELVGVAVNGWEFFAGPVEPDGRCFGLVDGFESELGYMLPSDITPHLMSGWGDPRQCLPARGWEWDDE